LHHNALSAQVASQAAQRLVERVDHAAASRLSAPHRAADQHGLTCNDTEDGLPLRHRVRIHDPGHGLLVSAEIRSRNIDVGTDERHHFNGVASRETLALPRGQCEGIASNPALGAAVWEAHECALPAHQHREGGHLAQIDVGSEPQPALRWSKDSIV
jgi:hypothetical protein